MAEAPTGGAEGVEGWTALALGMYGFGVYEYYFFWTFGSVWHLKNTRRSKVSFWGLEQIQAYKILEGFFWDSTGEKLRTGEAV